MDLIVLLLALLPRDLLLLPRQSSVRQGRVARCKPWLGRGYQKEWAVAVGSGSGQWAVGIPECQTLLDLPCRVESLVSCWC